VKRTFTFELSNMLGTQKKRPRLLAALGYANRSAALCYRRGLQLFSLLLQNRREIQGKDVAGLFRYKPRTAALLCRRWVEEGFLETTDPARKSRRYKLGDGYVSILDEMD
jgi:hypothetical protein